MKGFQNAGEDFEKVFNLKRSEMTPEQLWWLTKFAKHIRLRCRNNSAFNNYMNQQFSPARFETVQKVFEGRSYPGLKITCASGSVEETDE